MHGKIRNTLKKLPVLAAAVLALGAFAAPAWAANGATGVTTEDELQEALKKGGDISIAEGTTIGLTEPVVVTKDVTLSGAGTIELGKGFAKSESKAPITIESGATLTINDVTFDGAKQSFGYGNRAGGMIYVAGKLDLNSGIVQNFRSSKADGDNFGVIYVADGGFFTMDGGTLKDNELWGTPYDSKGVVHVAPGASFTLNDGSLTNNISAGAYGLSGVVFVSEDDNVAGTFIMNGGSISNNKSTAVKVGGNGSGSPAVFTMKGGTISGNTITQTSDDDADGPTEGGSNIFSSAVYVGYGAFTMEGGTISGNTAGYWGGGMIIAAPYNGAFFHMTGGTIEGNTAAVGGGVFVTHAGSASPDVRLSGGKIIDNTARLQGGGVYVVNGDTVHLENVVITDNTATMLGGGIWTCATGNVKTYITNGGAVFGNAASGDEDGSAGDDLAFVNHKVSGGTAEFKVSERIVGGGKVDYYADGGIDAGENADHDGMGASYLGDPNDSARYDASNPGKAITTDDLNVTDNNYALKSDVSDDAAKAATKSAKLVISGNKANRGAGVGANGNVIIGVAPDEGEEEQDYSLKVTKKWADAEESDKQSVEVALVSIVEGQEYQLDTVELNANNRWTATFDKLPEGDYTVKELNVPDGFESTVSKTTLPEGTTTYQVTVTNTKIKDGSLSIEKKVEGTETNRSFLFDVTLKDKDEKPLSGVYKATIYNGTEKIGSAEVMFEDGKSVRVDYKDKTTAKVISLKQGQKIVIEGIPAGATFTVSERYASDFDTAIDLPTGTITAGAESKVVVINTYDPCIPPTPPVDNDGDLDIEKKVVGEDAPDVEFTFTVTLDRKLSGTYGDATFKDGVATITLKAGETAHIEGLPKGTEYTVTEAESKHFTSSIKNGSGTITAGTVKVTATNTYEPPTDITVNLDPGKKYLEGRELNEGEFTFELWDGNTLIATSTNSVDPSDRHFGSFSFTFKQAPNTTKTYVMKERKGDLEGVTYDDRVYEVTVMTDDEGVKSVEYSPDFYENGAVFWNKYTPDKPEEPKPENPKPEQPKPEQPERPSGELPQTGDSSLSAGVLATVAVAGVALAGAGVTLLKKRSR